MTYDLPEFIQLKIIMMTPHPAADIMKELLERLDEINDDEFVEYTDLKTNQRRVYENMEWNTIVMYDYVYTNNQCIFFQGGNVYKIDEGERIIIKEL